MSRCATDTTRMSGLVPPGRGLGERGHLREDRGGVRVDVHGEALLTGLGMTLQRAVVEFADVGFVADVDDAARRGQKTQPHQHHRVDRRHLGAGLRPQPGAALHAPAHDRVGGPLEPLPARSDLLLHTQPAVAGGHLARRGGANLGVTQRKLLHPPSLLPRRDA